MTPSPRCRLTVAARFHLAPDWAARLAVGTGVREESGRFFPCGPWRPPTAEEMPLLVSGPGDGYWLPAGGVINDGYTMDKQEPDVLLLVRQAG